MCTVRCPRGVKPTDLAHALKSLAIEQGFSPRETDTPLMYRSFISSIKDYGRVHELGIMLRFYLEKFMDVDLKTPMKLLPMALGLLRHGRIPLNHPRRTKGREELMKILQKFAEVRGVQ